MEVAYPESFKNLLNTFSSNDVDNYVGQCNPNAKILIIAKEIGINMIKKVNLPNVDLYKEGIKYDDAVRYKLEILENNQRWRDNVKNKTTITDVPDWFDNDIVFGKKYNALAPYYGELFSNGNKGTNRTYYAYQKFINRLLQKEQKTGSQLDFYNYCFITELSTNCKPMSDNTKDEATKKSIDKRLINKKGILRHQFFQQFPIIILACYRYVDMYNIPILDCFGTGDKYEYQGIIKRGEYYDAFPEELKRQMPLYKYDDRLRKNEFINVHIIKNKEHPHLLLHTNHFCWRSYDWIKAVADECKKFIDEYNIQL